MRPSTMATLCALATVAIWSTVATAFKLTLSHLDPLRLLLIASTVSLVTLTVILTAQGRLARLWTLDRRGWVLSAVLGFLNPFAYYLILFGAYSRLPAQEAQPLNYTWAMTLSLLSVPLLGQKLRAMDLTALVVSYAGVLVIATQGDVASLRFTDPIGVALALGSTVIWALYWILNTRDTFDPVARLAVNFGFGTLYVTAAAAMAGSLDLPGWSGLLGGAYIGVFEMGVSFVLWLQALRLAPSAARISILVYLSPFASLIFIHHLVGEPILSSTLVGLGLILTGIGLQQVGKKKGD